MLSYAELESFFHALVTRARERGITCAITSGMACVHFGVAAATKDCDLLCDPDKADVFLDLLDETTVAGLACGYRGNLSPPLDARWLRGGWTAHFTWKTHGEETCLDVFGVAPRGSARWDADMEGFYAGPQIVGEMKRTNREKDWPFCTALGGQMLEAGDERGWLHIHDAEILRRLCPAGSLPDWLKQQRPVLGLAPFRDVAQTKRLLLAEKVFWSELDQGRIHIYQKHLRPYQSAVRRSGGKSMPLRDSHRLRVECALEHLPVSPLRDRGLATLCQEAGERTGFTFGTDVVEWLPKAEANYYGL